MKNLTLRHTAQLNNEMTDYLPIHINSYSVFDNCLYYVKIKNDIKKSTVTYDVCKFNLVTYEETKISTHQEQAKFVVSFVVFARQPEIKKIVQKKPAKVDIKTQLL